MPCSLFAVTLLNSEKLSIASCSSINKPDLKPLVHKSWKMGGRGERKGLSRVAFYCEHYLAGPVTSSGLFSGWWVSSSEQQIHIPRVTEAVLPS